MPAVCTVQPAVDAFTATTMIDPHELSDGTIYEDLATLIELRRKVENRLAAVLQVAQSRDVLADLAGPWGEGLAGRGPAPRGCGRGSAGPGRAHVAGAAAGR